MQDNRLFERAPPGVPLPLRQIRVHLRMRAYGPMPKAPNQMRRSPCAASQLREITVRSQTDLPPEARVERKASAIRCLVPGAPASSRCRAAGLPAPFLFALRAIRNGAPERIRTSDPQIRSLVLYPAELRVPVLKGANLLGRLPKGKPRERPKCRPSPWPATRTRQRSPERASPSHFERNSGRILWGSGILVLVAPPSAG